MLTMADTAGRGVGEMMTMADKGGRGGLPPPPFLAGRICEKPRNVFDNNLEQNETETPL
jgi:hypothetical protein